MMENVKAKLEIVKNNHRFLVAKVNKMNNHILILK